MTYLVNTYGKNQSLYPKNPKTRAKIDAQMNYNVFGFQPTLFKYGVRVCQ